MQNKYAMQQLNHPGILTGIFNQRHVYQTDALSTLFNKEQWRLTLQKGTLTHGRVNGQAIIVPAVRHWLKRSLDMSDLNRERMRISRQRRFDDMGLSVSSLFDDTSTSNDH